MAPKTMNSGSRAAITSHTPVAIPPHPRFRPELVKNHIMGREAVVRSLGERAGWGSRLEAHEAPSVELIGSPGFWGSCQLGSRRHLELLAMITCYFQARDRRLRSRSGTGLSITLAYSLGAQVKAPNLKIHMVSWRHRFRIPGSTSPVNLRTVHRAHQMQRLSPEIWEAILFSAQLPVSIATQVSPAWGLTWRTFGRYFVFF